MTGSVSICAKIFTKICTWKAIYDFLFMNNCNYVSIWYRFEDLSTKNFRVIRLIGLIRIKLTNWLSIIGTWLSIIGTRTKMAEKCLRYITSKIINETCPNILNKIYTHSYEGYITYIKYKFLDSYQIECNLL